MGEGGAGGWEHASPENLEILNSSRYIYFPPILNSILHSKAALLYIDKMFLLACWASSG